MMSPNASVEKMYLYPKPVDFRKSIDGLASLVDWISKSRCLTPVLFFFESTPPSGQGVVLGAQWLLPLAQAP